MRPHGHLLRTGSTRAYHADESALTSTAWMNGVFTRWSRKAVRSINRFLSTVHSYLSLFRSHGQRVFVEMGGRWQLLDVPSASKSHPNDAGGFTAMLADSSRYAQRRNTSPHALALSIEVVEGPATRFLISHHVALQWRRRQHTRRGALETRRRRGVPTAGGGDVGHRFPDGSFEIAAVSGTKIEKLGGDELLFLDGQSRQQPFFCLITAASSAVDIQIRGHLIAADSEHPLRADDREPLIPLLSAMSDETGAARRASERPHRHRALVHAQRARALPLPADWSSTPAAAGEHATSVRARSRCCWPWVVSSRCATCCYG